MQIYHDEGRGFVECAQKFGFAKTTWNKAITRNALRASRSASQDRRRRHNWADVQSYYDAGASFGQCKAEFRFCNVAWTKAVKRGEIKPRATTKSVIDVLRSKSSRWRKKARLIREGLLPRHCMDCGISVWRGKPLVIQIDHINGLREDWRFENLRMLCPNCHSQTPTYGGRNRKRVGVARADAGAVV